MRKSVIVLIGVFIVTSLTACSNKPEASEGASQNVQTEQKTAEAEQERETMEDDLSKQQGEISQSEATVIESNNQDVENTDSETTAEELLDLFIDGSINAVDSRDLASTFYITDLNADSYSVGEKIDLDNDGENELVINGPYGGIYLDARNNKIYEFAAGDGSALILSYTYYNGAVWIMYSNSMNAGYESYYMEKFEGADNLVAEMNFGEELVDPNNPESETRYTLNGAIISYDEYTELCSKIFAAQENADIMNGTASVHINSIEGSEENELENLIGEYDYLSDYGIGRLIIKKTVYGYDISDYESESSYRFLADSSNIDIIKNSKIYVKYPEQVLSDGTVIFSYYVLEYHTDEINVYYAKTADEEGQFLYHAIRKK